MMTIIFSLITFIVGWGWGRYVGVKKIKRRVDLELEDIKRGQQELFKRTDTLKKNSWDLKSKIKKTGNFKPDNIGRVGPRMDAGYVSPEVPSLGPRNKVTHIHIHRTEKGSNDE